MKSYSDDIVTPDVHNQDIKDAFQAQNGLMVTLSQSTQKQIRTYFIITNIVILAVGLGIGYLLCM